MKYLRDQIKDTAATATISSQEVKLNVGYYKDSCRLVPAVRNFTMVGDDLIIAAINSHLDPEIDLNDKSITLFNRYDINSVVNAALSGVIYQIEQVILEYLTSNLDTNNNKATTIYKWYKYFISARGRYDNEFNTDMYTIYKYLSQHYPTKGSNEAKGICMALEVLKNKYEKKGFVLDESTSNKKRRRRFR